MKQVRGVWLPDEEHEMTKFLNAAQLDGVGLYQYQKLSAAMKYVKQFRTAVDIGAHCGLWAMQLQKRFKHVHCFEPIERHIECLRLNAPLVAVYPCALGHKSGEVKLKAGVKSTGDTQIAPDGEYVADMNRLDEFDIEDVDFIKIDCEGYELFVLQGGESLIDKYHPPMIVEQKPGKGKFYGIGDTEAIKWLHTKGYKVREIIAGDYILTVT